MEASVGQGNRGLIRQAEEYLHVRVAEGFLFHPAGRKSPLDLLLNLQGNQEKGPGSGFPGNLLWNEFGVGEVFHDDGPPLGNDCLIDLVVQGPFRTLGQPDLSKGGG